MDKLSWIHLDKRNYLKKQGSSYMGIFKMFDSITSYISGAVARIFGPTDDQYPAIGVQPFTGEPFKQSHVD